MDRFASLDHVRRVRVVADELQSKIGFASCVEIGRSAGENIPATIRQLTAAHIVDEFGDTARFGSAKNIEVINVIGFECGIGFEFPEPIAFLRLKREKMVRAVFDGLLERASQLFFLPNWWYGRNGPIETYACTCRQNTSPRAKSTKRQAY